MNKEDSIKEKFKQALQSTYKVISDDYKVVKNKKNDEKIYDVGEIDNINAVSYTHLTLPTKRIV